MAASSAAHLLGSLPVLRNRGSLGLLKPVGRFAMIASTSSLPR